MPKVVDFYDENRRFSTWKSLSVRLPVYFIEFVSGKNRTQENKQKTGKWRKFKFTAFDESWIFYEIKWNSDQYNHALYYPITNVYLKEMLCEKWFLWNKVIFWNIYDVTHDLENTTTHNTIVFKYL